MRFYRLFFWIAFIVHLLLGAWLCLAPDLAKAQLHLEQVPSIYLQEHGLFLFMQACAYAYVAERPKNSIPVVALATLVNACLPLFALQAFGRSDIGARQLSLQLCMSGVMLPFLSSYFVWFYHVPRPSRFMPLLGIFGERK
ncbi:MAG TPA: hypothetical protein VK842_06365 [bacterium]|jgi:hypothetical protein|nr:hypothetical protein [bacterium]